MPQLLVAAVIGAGLYAGYRLLSSLADGAAREAERAAERVRAHTADGRIKDLGKLELDPRTGVYRPQRDNR